MVIFLDGKNALYRFGYAMAGLRTSEGQPTGAVYGLMNCLLRLKKKFPETRFVVVWDGPLARKQSWRAQLYPQYKNNRIDEHTTLSAETLSPKELARKKQAQSLRQAAILQEPLVKSLLTVLDIPQACLDTIEADDIIGVLTTAHRAQTKGNEIIAVWSSDRDFIQLMPHVELIRDVDKSKPLAFVTDADVMTWYRCRPQDVVSVRAIAGADVSDGFRAVIPKVGPVTAAKWVARGVQPYRKKFIDHWAAVDPRLQEVWPDIHRNYKLMSIITDSQSELFSAEERLQFRQEELRIQDKLRRPSKPNYQKLLAKLGELELMELTEKRHELLGLNS